MVTPEASASKHRKSPPVQRWHIRQWQAPTRASCCPATVIVTAPQRQCPVIAESEVLSGGERPGLTVAVCMSKAPEVDAREGQSARRRRFAQPSVALDARALHHL